MNGVALAKGRFVRALMAVRFACPLFAVALFIMAPPVRFIIILKRFHSARPRHWPAFPPWIFALSPAFATKLCLTRRACENSGAD